jgi:hypothetical protein
LPESHPLQKGHTSVLEIFRQKLIPINSVNKRTIPVKSLSQELEKEVELRTVGQEPQTARAKRSAERIAKSGKWVESLRCSDVNRLWSELHRIVSHHPLVRASRSAGRGNNGLHRLNAGTLCSTVE